MISKGGFRLDGYLIHTKLSLGGSLWEVSHIKGPCFELNGSLRPGGFHFVKIVYDLEYVWIPAYLPITVSTQIYTFI